MSGEAARYAGEFRVPAEHPAFAGHFPGHPVVPGVVILDGVVAAAERWLGRPVTVLAVAQAKFAGALGPDEAARLELTLEGAALRFALRRDDRTLAQGSMTLADADADADADTAPRDRGSAP